MVLCIQMQKAQRSYQKDKVKFEETRESHELDDQGCKYKLLLIEFCFIFSAPEKEVVI